MGGVGQAPALAVCCPALGASCLGKGLQEHLRANVFSLQGTSLFAGGSLVLLFSDLLSCGPEVLQTVPTPSPHRAWLPARSFMTFSLHLDPIQPTVSVFRPR